MSKEVKVQFKKLHEDAVIPRYAHPQGDSGMDIFSIETAVIHPGKTKMVSIGLASSVPLGYELQIRPTSGNSAKTPIRIANAPGTIDANFRGEIKVIISNYSDETYTIAKGSKIAQLVLQEVPKALIVEVDEFTKDTYDNTRDEAGYGSTGIAEVKVD